MIQQIYPSPAHSFLYELNKDFHFAAAHYIPAEEAGKCRSLHGHTYFVNVTVAGDQLDDAGFLVNFADIKRLIHDRFDHRLLNDDDSFDDADPRRFPSTEIMAATMAQLIQRYLDTLPHRPLCVQIFLRETPSSYVVYRPGKADAANEK